MVEAIVVTLVVCFFFSQVLRPIWKGTGLFPIFRRESKLERELRKLRQLSGEESLEAEVDRRRKEVDEQFVNRMTGASTPKRDRVSN
jgi:hypothetical protein